jgi:imidazolonepropionase-like amidohydrolase
MNNAGMSSMQVVVAATSRSAAYFKLDKMGSLAAGKDADFLVLERQPARRHHRHAAHLDDRYQRGRSESRRPAPVTDEGGD